MIDKNKLICPACGSELFFALDEWGRTPWHLHCQKCQINIGTNSMEKAIELIQEYHQPDTWIEYYDNKIQVLFEKGKYIIKI